MPQGPTPMKDLDAIMFALIGSIMELLPLAFPSWFPRAGGEVAGSRVLWLEAMGAVQIGLGASFMVGVHLVPALARIFSSIPAGERESISLPDPRAVAGK
jgi:hypothetical protein